MAAAKIRAAALACLARREYAVAELRQKLCAAGHDQEAVDSVVAALVGAQLVSDARFAEVLVRSRRNKGYGPLRIQQELRERGVADDVIREHLDVHDPIWMDVMRQLRRKHFGAAPPKDYAEQARQSRYLQYRGFKVDQIRRVFDVE